MTCAKDWKTLIPADTVERFCEAVVRCKAEMENGDIVGISRH